MFGIAGERWPPLRAARLAAAPPDDPLYQLAKEIMALAADPHRYDHDEVHGDSLIQQQRLAAALVGAPAPRTSDDISAVFEEQRGTAKANMLRDVGNQNPWRDAPMQAADHGGDMSKKNDKKKKDGKGGGLGKALFGLVALLAVAAGGLYLAAPDVLRQGLAMVGLQMP